MTLVEAIESAKYSTEKRRLYWRALLACLLAILLFSTAKFSGWTQSLSPRVLILDFDGFHLVARMLWMGQIRSAYHLPALFEFQKSLSGLKGFLPWTYPPQFVLLLAPLALLPLGMAYLVFTGVTFAAYLAVLKRIAGDSFVPVLMIAFPALLITICCGQNGFLTGSLIGLTCLGFANRRPVAGLPLGLMIIKPHLAVAFAFYAFVDRRWGAVLIAAATVLLTTLVATAILGFGVWPAFFGGIHEAGIFLVRGFYPLFRMVSLYAAFRSLGVPAFYAMPIQVLAACLALAAVFWASRHLASRQTLGVTAIASLLISPYVYDYDMPIFAIGLALLHDDLIQFARASERLLIYALITSSSAFGLAYAFLFGGRDLNPDGMPWALAGLILVAAAALILRITFRSIAIPLTSAKVGGGLREAAIR